MAQNQNDYERMAHSGGSMDTVKEFFDAIKGQLAERLANPFTGAFCIAWVIWNFRLLMVFTGKGTYQEKFLYIDTSLYPDWRYWAMRGVAIPMATAVAYLWAYPRATRWLAEDHRKQQTKVNNLMKAAAGEALLSIDESTALRTRFAEAQQAWLKDRERITAEVDNEKATSASLAKTNEGLRTEIVHLRSSLHPTDGNGPEPVEERPPADSPRTKFRLPQEFRSLVGNDLAQETYNATQLRILSWLREGRSAELGDIKGKMELPMFEVSRAVDRLTDLGLLVLDQDNDISISAKGRAVLGAFVDDNQWDFATQGA